MFFQGAEDLNPGTLFLTSLKLFLFPKKDMKYRENKRSPAHLTAEEAHQSEDELFIFIVFCLEFQ